MLEIKSLYKSYGEKVLFSDWNLSVKKGEFIVVHGVSGCGKTTLLNMIGSVERPDNGHILFEGNDVYDRRYQRLYLQTKVGFLFQNFALLESKSIEDNLKIVKKNVRTDMPFEKALSIVGLDNDINTKVYKLSGGEQQRVAIARLMLKKCELVLADEPTGSLDSANSERIVNLLSVLNNSGKTIIVVTHDNCFEGKGYRYVEL